MICWLKKYLFLTCVMEDLNRMTKKIITGKNSSGIYFPFEKQVFKSPDVSESQEDYYSRSASNSVASIRTIETANRWLR